MSGDNFFHQGWVWDLAPSAAVSGVVPPNAWIKLLLFALKSSSLLPGLFILKIRDYKVCVKWIL